MDARRATPLDMDLAADFDVVDFDFTDLTFAVRTRFIDCPLIRSDVRLAYVLHMATSSSIICADRAGSDASQWAPQLGLEPAASLPANGPIFS